MGLARALFDEAKHPRVPGGHHGGGEFASKSSGAAASTARAKMAAAKSAPGLRHQTRGGGGGGIRGLLAAAGSVGQLNVVASAEALRLTGRDIPFNMAGSDLQVAREHSEGVLRILERYPQSSIQAVEVSPLAGQGSDGRGTPYAMIREVDGEDHIAFSSEWAGKPTAYRESLSRAEENGFLARGQGTPMATGIHEAAHQSGPGWMTEPRASYVAERESNAAGMKPDEYVRDQLGSYATVNGAELTVTGVTDVVLHGDSASDLSRALYEMNDREYHKFNGV